MATASNTLQLSDLHQIIDGVDGGEDEDYDVVIVDLATWKPHRVREVRVQRAEGSKVFAILIDSSKDNRNE